MGEGARRIEGDDEWGQFVEVVGVTSHKLASTTLNRGAEARRHLR